MKSSWIRIPRYVWHDITTPKDSPDILYFMSDSDLDLVIDMILHFSQLRLICQLLAHLVMKSMSFWKMASSWRLNSAFHDTLQHHQQTPLSLNPGYLLYHLCTKWRETGQALFLGDTRCYISPIWFSTIYLNTLRTTKKKWLDPI